MERPYSPLHRLWLLLAALAFVALFSIPARGQSAERLSRFVISTTPATSQCDEAKEVGWLWWDTDADTDGALYICTGAGGWKAVGGGVATTDFDTSAELAAILTDENGTGAALFDGATSPNFTTDAQVGGVSACLENGTNCPGSLLGSTFASGGVMNTLSNTATNYFPASGIITAATVTEGDVRSRLPTNTVNPVEIICQLNSSPGSGNSYTFTLRTTTSGDSDWACTIADSDVNCIDTTGTPLDDAFLSWSSVPASTPTARRASCAVKF